jgi:carbamoylphosphate synthase large subunit
MEIFDNNNVILNETELQETYKKEFKIYDESFKFDKFHIKTSNFPNNYETVTDIDIKIFEKLMKNLKYTGGTCINFKYNTTTKKIDIFELNPRFGGSAFTNNFIYELLCIK